MGLGPPKTEASRLCKGTPCRVDWTLGHLDGNTPSLKGCGPVMPSGPLSVSCRPYSVGTSSFFLEASGMEQS